MQATTICLFVKIVIDLFRQETDPSKPRVKGWDMFFLQERTMCSIGLRLSWIAAFLQSTPSWENKAHIGATMQ